MAYRIDQSMNDAPYQGIHIFKDNEHVGEFIEDDAPVHDYNADQRIRAAQIVQFMNGEYEFPHDPEIIFNAFKHMKFPRPHERIKLEPKE